MCLQLMFFAFAATIVLLVVEGVRAWIAFAASVNRHRTLVGLVLDEGPNDDTGLTLFERKHLQRVIVNGFSSHQDNLLRKLVAKTRLHLLISVAVSVTMAIILVMWSSSVCEKI
ncbi:hypothetical protein [Rhodoferax sp. OV413]|uniref:hypothetical protein n=1 Tax=Rhodoferax sp. OV413 TaxID=1855285 RepID=UPI00115FB7F1|nr:hypothetical protein [Rhodoferax sp. OV413]